MATPPHNFNQMDQFCKDARTRFPEFVTLNSEEFEKQLVFAVLKKLNKEIENIDFNKVMKLTEEIITFVNEICSKIGLSYEPLYTHDEDWKSLEKLGFQQEAIINSLQKGLKKSIFTKVISKVIQTPDFIFPEYTFYHYLPHNEIIPVMVKDIKSYIKRTEQVHLMAVFKVRDIIEGLVKQNPNMKICPKEIGVIFNCIQHLFWPQMLKSLQNILNSLLQYVRISGKASLDDKCVKLDPDEEDIFDNLAQTIKIYEEDGFSLDAIIINDEKVNIPQYDYSVEVHKCLLQLFQTINSDYKAIREYFNDRINSCLACLDERYLVACKEEGIIFGVERLEQLAEHYSTSEDTIRNSLPQIYYYKVYRFDCSELLEELLSKCRSLMEQVASYIEECIDMEIKGFTEKLLEYDKIAKREVSSGKELAYVHKTVIGISTSGLEEMVGDLKNLYKAIFAAISCNPNYSPVITRATGIHASLVSLKETCKDACNTLEAQKFMFEESILEIPKKVTDEINYYDVYHIHAFSEVRRYDKIEQVFQFMKKIKKWLAEKVEMIEFVHSEQTALNIPKSVLPNLEELKIFVECFDKLVRFLRKWNITYWTILNGSIHRYTLDELERIIEDNFRTLLLFQKYFQGHIKNAVIEQLRFRYDAKYPHSSDSSEGEGDDEKKKKTPPGPLALVVDALEEVRYLKSILPILGILTNERLSLRHWEMMSEISGKNMVPFLSSSVKDYLEIGIEEFLDQVVWQLSDCS